MALDREDLGAALAAWISEETDNLVESILDELEERGMELTLDNAQLLYYISCYS